MIKAQKYRFYPTKEQEQLLAQTFGCVRVVYNKLLEYRKDSFFKEKKKVDYPESSKVLTELKNKEEFSWLNDVSAVPLQQTLRHLQTAYKNFWDKRAKYPTFKKKHSKQSAEFSKSAFTFKDGKLYIAKSKEHLNIVWSKELPSEPSTITISKDPFGRYFVSMRCEFEPVKLKTNNKTIGVDLGIKDAIVTSDNQKSGNPKFTKKYETKLTYHQRKLSKKKKGSSNFNKAKRKVAKIHAKIADSRRDFTHKLTTKLIRDNQTICVEDLAVKNMIRNPKLSKHIADVNWGEIVRQLKYKAEWYGRNLIVIDRFFPSSKQCSNCNWVVDKLTLDIRRWKCPKCSTEHDRDINASKNILAAGLAVSACGATESGVAIAI